MYAARETPAHRVSLAEKAFAIALERNEKGILQPVCAEAQSF